MAKRKTTEEFIEDAYCKHYDTYNYKLVDYKNNKTKVKIICPIHGTFEQEANSHLQGHGCPKCAEIYIYNKLKKTTEQFIEDAYCKHGDTYNYKLVQYKNRYAKVKIICSIHGMFEQIPKIHLKGCGCPKCVDNVKNSTQEFIEKAQEIHGDKYNYSLVQYENNNTKIKIICPVHGIFEQIPRNHTSLEQGCPKCAGVYEKQYYTNNIPVYDTYTKQLSPYGVSCRRNKEDKNILEVKCMYCDRWYIPTLSSVYSKIRCINGKQSGESNLYCSNVCKQACPTYKQILYPKGYKDYRTNTSREVQEPLRKLVLKRDNYTCQRCGATDTILHCHHYEGIEINPIESADADNCIILCKDCHNNIHKADKCGINDYKRKECK